MRKILAVLAISLLGAAGVVAGVASTAVATPNLVTICHYDHGGEPHTIAINENAVDAHLNPRGNGREHQGDHLGPCQGDTTGTTGTTGTTTVVTTTDTTSTEITPTTPTTTGPRCPDGSEGGEGKDGEPGFDCPNENPTTPTTTSSTPVVPTTPTGTTPTTPTVTTPTTPETTPEPDPAPPLDEELEEQAEENEEFEEAAGRNPDRARASSREELPHTGFPVWALFLIGATLISGGFILRKYSW